MSNALRRTFLPALLAEAALWYGTSLVFLFAYLHFYAGPSDAIAPHLELLSILLLALFSLRILISLSLPRGVLRSITSGALLTLFLSSVLAYYALVLIGLHFWGRVTTWRLIATYSAQSSDLLQALDLSPALTFASIALVILLVFSCIVAVSRRWGWVDALSRYASRLAGVLFALLGLALASTLLFLFVDNPATASGEPVSLTFFPDYAAHRLQSNATGGGAALDVVERAAREAYTPDRNAHRRNVFLFVSDALRADHMGVYGYGRDTTPYLSQLEREGKLAKVSGMTSACSESACGLMAIARSKYVYQLSKDSYSLTELLKQYGYRVDMILGGDHTNFYGLRELYGAVDDYFDGSMVARFYMNDDDLVLDRLGKLANWDGRPTMIQFHLMSSHALGKRHAAAQKFLPASNYAVLTRHPEMISSKNISDGEAVNYYDNGIFQFDGVVRSALAQLQEKGYLDDAIVVITGDHGEMLGEHGQFGHANGVYEPVLHVPFLIIRYGYRHSPQAVLPRIVSQIDIAPTILTELSMPIPSTWSGRPIEDVGARDFVLFQQGAQIGLFDLRGQTGVLKYWRNLQTKEEFAFNVSNDPVELQNLIGSVDVKLLADWRLAIARSETVGAN